MKMKFSCLLLSNVLLPIYLFIASWENACPVSILVFKALWLTGLLQKSAFGLS